MSAGAFCVSARRTDRDKMRSIENTMRAILRDTEFERGLPRCVTFAERVAALVGSDALATELVEPLLKILPHAGDRDRLVRHLHLKPGYGSKYLYFLTFVE